MTKRQADAQQAINSAKADPKVIEAQMASMDEKLAIIKTSGKDVQYKSLLFKINNHMD